MLHICETKANYFHRHLINRKFTSTRCSYAKNEHRYAYDAMRSPKTNAFLNDSLNSLEIRPSDGISGATILLALYADITVMSIGPTKHVKSEVTTNPRRSLHRGANHGCGRAAQPANITQDARWLYSFGRKSGSRLSLPKTHCC